MSIIFFFFHFSLVNLIAKYFFTSRGRKIRTYVRSNPPKSLVLLAFSPLSLPDSTSTQLCTALSVLLDTPFLIGTPLSKPLRLYLCLLPSNLSLRRAGGGGATSSRFRSSAGYVRLYVWGSGVCTLYTCGGHMLVFVMCDMDHVMYTSRDLIYTPQDVPSLSLFSLCAVLLRRAPPPLFICWIKVPLPIDKGFSAHR